MTPVALRFGGSDAAEEKRKVKDDMSAATDKSLLWATGLSAHYVMVSKIQWKPFWLATQLYPQNDWTGWNFVCTEKYLHRPDSAQC